MSIASPVLLYWKFFIAPDIFGSSLKLLIAVGHWDGSKKLFVHYTGCTLGFLIKIQSLLSLCSLYLSLVSASLLKSAINIVVLPPSRIIGYKPTSEPDKSFESGTLCRLCSCIIRYSSVVFFIVRFYISFSRIIGIFSRYGYFLCISRFSFWRQLQIIAFMLDGKPSEAFYNQQVARQEFCKCRCRYRGKEKPRSTILTTVFIQ